MAGETKKEIELAKSEGADSLWTGYPYSRVVIDRLRPARVSRVPRLAIPNDQRNKLSGWVAMSRH